MAASKEDGKWTRRSSRFILETGFELWVPLASESNTRLPLLVALHGIGQSARAFAEEWSEVCDARRFVLFPDGPLPFEVQEKNGRRQGQAWYIYTGDQAEFLRSADRTATYLNGVIQQVVREYPIDTERIALLGYSQGGYMAGLMALKEPKKWSTLVCIAARLKSELVPETNSDRIPVLSLHGKHDRLIDPGYAENHASLLRARGWVVDFRTYDVGHRITDDMRRDAALWLAMHTS